MRLVIADAELDGRRVDVAVDEGHVAAIGPGLARRADEILQADGGAVLPALHDHHVHLRSMAVRASSVDVGPAVVRGGRDELLARLRQAARRGRNGWVRAVDYHESVAGELDRDLLDQAVPDHPVRVQHRSGELWMLNSAALRCSGLEHRRLEGVERDSTGRATGRLWRLDTVAREAFDGIQGDVAAVCRAAAALGIGGLTDATPDRDAADVAAFARLRRSGRVGQRLCLMAPPSIAEPTDRAITVGPVKTVLDDRTLPSLDALSSQVRAAHAAGRQVAVHCVTRVQLVLILAALEDAGALPGDRVEHGAVIDDDLLPRLRRLGVVVVTQPNFVAERGDYYRRDVPPADHDLLYRCGQLRASGISVAAGTDAPFGQPDPWAAMRAAVARRTLQGTVLGPQERVAPLVALRLFLGSAAEPAKPRRVAVGAAADLCVLRLPLAAALERLEASDVRATVIEGELRHVA